MTPILGIMASSISGSKAITGAFESIATVTASGGETSLSFTSIPATFKHLQIRGLSKDATNSGNNSISNTINFNGDTGTNYTLHRILGSASAVSVTGLASRSNITVESSSIGSATANLFAVSLVDIQDYASTTKYKTVKNFAGSDSNGVGTTNNVALSSSVWMNTNAITTILITAAGGSFSASSTFALYGIKG
jgi:hypothetical protein